MLFHPSFSKIEQTKFLPLAIGPVTAINCFSVFFILSVEFTPVFSILNAYLKRYTKSNCFFHIFPDD